MQLKTLHKHVLDALEELQANDIVSLKVTKLTSITDVIIICSGRSTRQVKAIADNVWMRMKERDILVLSVQTDPLGEWVVVDLGEIVVHVMLPETRAFYDLEKLWSKSLKARQNSEQSSEESSEES